MGHLYIDGVFESSEDIFKKYNIPRSHLFPYFQVRNFAKSNNPNFPSPPLDSV